VSNLYETVQLSVPFSPGDRLYLFSDGIYEVPAPSGELWGDRRFVETVVELGQRPIPEVIEKTVERAAQWLGRDEFPDDVAVMGVELAG
jgi:sigma-B regulation protein RsbU (phosphoserine phosphatase)